MCKGVGKRGRGRDRGKRGKAREVYGMGSRISPEGGKDDERRRAGLQYWSLFTEDWGK